MRNLAEERVRILRGRRADADEKADGEDLEIVGLGEGDASRRARSHRPIRRYGEGAARRRDHRAGQRSVKKAAGAGTLDGPIFTPRPNTREYRRSLSFPSAGDLLQGGRIGRMRSQEEPAQAPGRRSAP